MGTLRYDSLTISLHVFKHDFYSMAPSQICDLKDNRKATCFANNYCEMSLKRKQYFSLHFKKTEKSIFYKQTIQLEHFLNDVRTEQSLNN